VSTRPSNPAKKISWNNLNRRIAQYSLSAGVAGVSVLALTAPAAGEVVVTRRTIPIPLTPIDMPHPVIISMANNGVDNFTFHLTNSPPNLGRSSSFRSLALVGATSNAAAIYQGYFIGPLPRGAKIGASAGFSPFESAVEQSLGDVSGRGFRGYWGGNLKDHYVGVRFSIAGQTHYGWIRLTVTTDPDPHGPAMSAKITGYAYETVPNKTIQAGTAGIAAASAENPTAELQAPKNIRDQNEPSLGMLAMGAEALPMWRREETSVLGEIIPQR
jgi:hypothetical protein